MTEAKHICAAEKMQEKPHFLCLYSQHPSSLSIPKHTVVGNYLHLQEFRPQGCGPRCLCLLGEQVGRSQVKEARSMLEKGDLLKAQRSEHTGHLPPSLQASTSFSESITKRCLSCSHHSRTGRNITPCATTQKIQYPLCG